MTVDDGDGSESGNFQVSVSAATAQTGGVQGTVYEDKNDNQQPDGGEGVPGASVSLVEVAASAFTNPVETDANGNYAFTDVPVGDYSLTVSAAGYTGPPAVQITVTKDAVATVPPIRIEKATETLHLPYVQSGK